MERLLVCSNYDLNELYHQISLKHMSKYIKMFQKDAKNFLEIATETISDASFFVAKWLHDRLGRIEIEKIFMDSFNFLTDEESYAVKKIVYERFEEEKDTFISIIESEIKKILLISNKLNLEGFSTFCLKNYKQELFLMIDSCLEEYWTQEEYQDFIDLLRYFITWNRRETSLYINTNSEGQYQLYDENFQNITNQSIQQLNEDFWLTNEEEDTQNEMLLNLLVLLAPEKIYLYGMAYIKNKNFIKTLTEIFKNKIIFFENCFDFSPHKKM